jgi:hypothetical protein
MPVPAGDYNAQLHQTTLSNQIAIVDPVVRASVAGDSNPITYGVTFVSGALAMTGIQVPAGFRGTITLIPTGAFTGALGGVYANDGITEQIPFAKVFTAVVQRALYLTTDGNFWYPSA